MLDIHDLALARQQGRDSWRDGDRPAAAGRGACRAGRPPPRDLEGASAGVTGLPSDSAVLRSMVSGDGGNPDRVREVTIGFNAVASLLGGPVAAATAFWNVEGVALARRRPGFRSSASTTSARPRIPSSSCVSRAGPSTMTPRWSAPRSSALVRGYEFTLYRPAEQRAGPQSSASAGSTASW